MNSVNPNYTRPAPSGLSETVGVAAGHDFCLAPIRGLTDSVYRRCFARHFDGLDRCLAPFVETMSGERVNPSRLSELAGAPDEPLPLVPQVLSGAERPLAVMIEALAALGFREVNLNAGCPWRRITRKGRGAGLLEAPERLWRLLDVGCARLPKGFSLKIRLGYADAGALANLMPRLNDFPLSEIVIHPRTAVQGYAGDVDLDAFAECIARSAHPVTYNGDIRTPGDWFRLQGRFPGLRRWMIGRGLLADPFLLEELRAGSVRREPARLKAFLSDYRDACLKAGRSETATLGRLKALWAWMAPAFEDGKTLLLTVRRTQSLAEYDGLAARGCFERT